MRSAGSSTFLCDETLDTWRALFADQHEWVRAVVEPFASELAEIPDQAIWNGWFESGDAELYYAVLRSFKPLQVIELGSGFSSSFAARALSRNGRGELICIDPSPRVSLPAEAHHVPVPWQKADRAMFEALNPGDVLFIDSSHEVEETLSYYPLLDRLAPGVMVHHHDMLYPNPPAFPEEHLMISYYALRHDSWNGLASLALLHHDTGERFQLLFPSAGKAPWRSPGSAWLRKRSK